jgi:hypothetical protein
MTSDAIEALTETELKEALIGRGVDVSNYRDKKELVSKARGGSGKLNRVDKWNFCLTAA